VWRTGISKFVRIAFQWVFFGIEATLYTLFVPIRRLFAMVFERYKATAQKQKQKRQQKQRREHTKQELLRIDKTAKMLLPIEHERIQKGDGRAKKFKKAV
jgi:cell shape-determining protein MreC